MSIEYGSTVIDKEGKSLGEINYIVRDTWTGDVKKFMILRRDSSSDIIISPDDVSEIREDKVILKVSLEEIMGRASQDA